MKAVHLSVNTDRNGIEQDSEIDWRLSGMERVSTVNLLLRLDAGISLRGMI